MSLHKITDKLVRELSSMEFAPPVVRVYNPLVYARKPLTLYEKNFGRGQKEILLIGMNPGPWGMAQTGVPFGEISSVKEWMGIEADVDTPEIMHPKRPITGFACTKSEVSGRRLWGWARERFGTPKAFFSRFFVANYCPLVFMEESGKNRTPDKLPKAEKELLFKACDRALIATVNHFKPDYLIGIGVFAATRAKRAVGGMKIKTGRITHPSPANPKANRGWAPIIEKELKEMGITLP